MHPSFRLFPVLLGLPGVNQKLDLTSHTESGLLRDSNSCLPKAPVNPALLGASDGDPEHHATAIVSKLNKEEKRIWFLNRPNLHAAT
jgi:hypothetical protein